MKNFKSTSQIIENDLVALIKKGKILPGAQLPSQSLLAKKYKVSKNTVYHAFARLKDRGYITILPGKGAFAHDPHTIQRKRIRQNCISFIFPNMRGLFISDILRGIQSVASQHDYYLAIFDSSDDFALEAENLKRAVELQSKGIILFPVNHPNPQISNHETYIAIQKTGTPLLFIDNYPLQLKVDYVVANDYQGIYDLTSYVIEMGHRRIGYISGPTHISSLYHRYRGFCQAMVDHGLEIYPQFIFPNPNEQNKDGDISLEEFINTQPKNFMERLATSQTKPTILVAINSTSLALEILKKHHIQLPDEISIVSTLEDYSENIYFSVRSMQIPLSGHRSIELTGCVQPSFSLGQKAAEVLLEKVEGKTEGHPIAIELEMPLHIGDSVKRIGTSPHQKGKSKVKK